ncbi:glycoside hydrolase family 18 protein [Thermobifida halotolerans]|uniref:chitinase n=1 Tax=Thermobifida halotolerans TaxID=483545 RepID=A0A399G667_9ACTN|nr:glycoside hydrolase family 18 protein [Thermobifida halotolerans]UOE19960.1 glycoside hydrolase family 18 protein [Thermobifida halotolerans]
MSGRHRILVARRRPTALTWVAVLLAVGVALLGGVVAVTTGGPRNAPPMQSMAYFADWNTANRGYSIKDVDDSGAAARLDRLIWAFGDVSDEGLCHVPPDADQPWQIFQRRYSAEESVDGQADAYEQPLAGSLNQLRKLQEKYPGLRASISLGGWNWSTHFSEAVRTEESRERFVASCVDLWLRGNLPRLEGEPQGGEGVAAGIFDGIDLDWEWPGGNGHPDNVEHPDDRRNFTLVVAEFREQLDALGRETGQHYTLSASLTHDEQIMRDSYEPEVFEHLDFAVVQGYDFTGSWAETTGHHSQLYAPEDGPDQTSVDRVVRQYLDHGLPADKLVLGIPGYGRGWSGVAPGPDGDGRFTRAEDGADGDYGESTDAYETLERLDGERFFDRATGAYWIYDGDEWWSYDTPEVVRLKGDYAADHGLRGLVLWNLDMDPEGELVAAMAESLD